MPNQLSIPGLKDSINSKFSYATPPGDWQAGPYKASTSAGVRGVISG